MDQLMLSLVLSIGAARVLRTAANKTYDSLSVATQPPLPLTRQRLELIKALTKETSHSSDQRIAQPRPRQTIIAQTDRRPGGQAHPSQLLLVLPRKIWVLLSVLIFVALLPNLTVVPLFWLRFLDRPTSTAATITAHQGPMADQSIGSTQATLSANTGSIVDPSTVATLPVLSAPSIVEATVGQDVSFPIAIDGTDGMPASSRIIIKGLPSGSKLSNGHPGSNREWSLNPDEIGDLHLVLGNVIDDTKLAIQLVGPDGRVVAGTATILKRTIKPQASAMVPGIETQLTESRVSSEQPQWVEIIGLAQKPVDPEADLSRADPAPLPARKPKADNDDVGAEWIKPSTSVNLRKGPSSSAAIISVVERATKLRAIGRRKGWVRVTNPATSETGWIYAENIGPLR